MNFGNKSPKFAVYGKDRFWSGKTTHTSKRSDKPGRLHGKDEGEDTRLNHVTIINHSVKETIMSDPTEMIRRELVAEINTEPGSREYLQAQHGQVWDTNQLQEDFEVLGFMAPIIAVRRKSDGVKGSLFFQHGPRFYFNFQPH